MVALRPPSLAIAVIVADPKETKETTPLLSTVATSGSDEVKVQSIMLGS